MGNGSAPHQPYDESQVQLAWSSVRKVGAGYHNLGNTCYMNSVLQVLVHTPPLAQLFLSNQHPPKIHYKYQQQNNNGSPPGGDLDRRLHAILNHSYKTAKLAPNPIAKVLPQINKFFKPGRQQDAHEFLVCFLDKMHEQVTGTCLKSKNKQPNNVGQNLSSKLDQHILQNGQNSNLYCPQGKIVQNGYIQSNGQKFLHYNNNSSDNSTCKQRSNLGNGQIQSSSKNLNFHQKQSNNNSRINQNLNSNYQKTAENPEQQQQQCDSYIRRIFGGKFRSEISCLNVDYKSETSEDFSSISLDIFKSNNIQFSLQNFVKEEILDGQNKYKCPLNNKLEKAVKKCNISEPPNILILQLKRFQFGHIGRKLDHHVKFDQNLNLAPFIVQKNQQKNHNQNLQQLNQQYELYGMVVHLGMSMHGGHYIAYIRSSNGKWYCMDDESVHPVHVEHVLRQKAYILFYVRKQPRTWLLNTYQISQLNNQINQGQQELNAQQIQNGQLEFQDNTSANSSQQNVQIDRVVQLQENLNQLEQSKYQLQNQQLQQNGQQIPLSQQKSSKYQCEQKSNQYLQKVGLENQQKQEQQFKVQRSSEVSQQILEPQKISEQQPAVLLRQMKVQKNSSNALENSLKSEGIANSLTLNNINGNININIDLKQQLQIQSEVGSKKVALSGDVQLQAEAGKRSKEAAQFSGLLDVKGSCKKEQEDDRSKSFQVCVGQKRRRSLVFHNISSTATTIMNQVMKFSPAINKLRKISGSSVSSYKKRKLNHASVDEDVVGSVGNKIYAKEVVQDDDDDQSLSEEDKMEEEDDQIFGLDDAVEEFQEWGATPPSTGNPEHAPWSGMLKKLQKAQVPNSQQIHANSSFQTEPGQVFLKSQRDLFQEEQKQQTKQLKNIIASGKQAEEFLLKKGSSGPTMWDAVDGKKMLQIQQFQKQRRGGVISRMNTERVLYDEAYDRGKQKKIKLNNKKSLLNFQYESGNLFQRSYDETQKKW